MSATFQIILSAITSFVITAGGAIGIVLASNGKDGLNNIAWIASITLGLVSAAKDVRNMLSLPPLTNGNYQTLARLYERDDNANKHKGSGI